MDNCLYRELSAHHILRVTAYESSGEYYGLYSEVSEFLCHFDEFISFLTALESVACVELCEQRHLAFSCRYSLAYAHPHEAHPVVKASSELVTAVIGIWRKELRNQISVSCMDLDRIESCLDRKLDCLSVCICNLIYLLQVHLLDEGR